MEFFFNPKGIAVVGATPNPHKGGYAILKNLIIGYKGNIYPVNPQYREIEGLTCFPSVSAIDGHVDLAIVFVSAKHVPNAIEECARKGVPGAIIESGGFAETGQNGINLQNRIKEIAAGSGIRLWGPNCMGLVDAFRGYVFSFMDPYVLEKGLLPGNVSLIVQSGFLSAGFLSDLMSHAVMGISKVCSIGNKIDINECDLLPYLLKDPKTDVVGLYLESFSDGRSFFEICRESSKPIVVLTGGKSSRGAKAALSHTASLAGNHRVISGVLAQAGVVEARDFKQMADLCRSLGSVPAESSKKSQGRVAILTFSGGSGIVSADFIEEYKLSVAELSETTKEALGKFFPDWMPVSNPVDLWPSLEKHWGGEIDVYSAALKALLDDPNVDAVLINAFAGNIRLQLNIDDVASQRYASGKPVFIWLLGRREDAFRFKAEALSLGIPVFDELGRAVECLSAVLHRRKSAFAHSPQSENKTTTQLSLDIDEIIKTRSGVLDEWTSKRILKAHGIPTVEEELVSNPVELLNSIAAIGFPVVMKGLQPGKVHKSELGLVYLNIVSKEAALEVFHTLKRKIGDTGSIIISKQIKGKIEIIIGMLRDQQFGPCVMLGMGGIMAEVFENAVFASAPLTKEEAQELIGRFKGQRLLDGFRGEPVVDREELARLIVTVGNLGFMYPRLHEIDINPLIVSERGIIAVDAAIVIK